VFNLASNSISNTKNGDNIGMSLVSLWKIQENTIDSMKQAIFESLHMINFSFEDKIKNVVIKPNLCYYWDYTTGQTTDPKFIAALIDFIRERTSATKISLVESDASAMRCKQAFKMLGYERLSHEYDVNLINLSQDKTDPMEVSAGSQKFHLMVPRTIQNADLKINVPKIKYTIEEIKITCALKNIFGCNPYRKKFHFHPKLGETIVALNKVMRFDLCIVDGNIVSGIAPRRLGLVMASKDPVAIDAAAAKIAGLNPRTIKYLQLAKKEGLGNTSFIPKGVPLQYFKDRYPRKDVMKKIMGIAYNAAIELQLGKRLGLE
jgi:uncharacterized protein (DUF362 family)